MSETHAVEWFTIIFSDTRFFWTAHGPEKNVGLCSTNKIEAMICLADTNLRWPINATPGGDDPKCYLGVVSDSNDLRTLAEAQML